MTATPEEPEYESPEVDEAGRESFPASDPPASWAGPDVVPDEGDPQENVVSRPCDSR